MAHDEARPLETILPIACVVPTASSTPFIVPRGKLHALNRSSRLTKIGQQSKKHSSACSDQRLSTIQAARNGRYMSSPNLALANLHGSKTSMVMLSLRRACKKRPFDKLKPHLLTPRIHRDGRSLDRTAIPTCDDHFNLRRAPKRAWQGTSRHSVPGICLSFEIPLPATTSVYLLPRERNDERQPSSENNSQPWWHQEEPSPSDASPERSR